MSKTRYVIPILALLLIVAFVPFVMGADPAAAPSTTPPTPTTLQGLKAPSVNANNVAAWSGYVYISNAESYAPSNYEWFYVAKVYGTTSTAYNGWYQIYPGSNQVNTYSTGLVGTQTGHWVWISVSGGQVIYAESTPYTYGNLM
jgi:hypothetical protein